MSQLDVIGLGLSTLDILFRMEQLPTWEHGTQLSDFCFDGGGPVGTAMVAAARLGARAGYLGVAGSDRTAELKLETLIDAGVDLSHLVRYPGPERSVILVTVHEATGERIFSGLRSRAQATLSPEQLDRSYLLSADYLHLDGHHLDAAYAAAGWMQTAGKTVVYDGVKGGAPISDAVRRVIERVDVLIGGQGFVPALTAEDDLARAGRKALTMGPCTVVQTLGERGCWTTTGEQEFATPAFEVDVVDTTGAGDVFHGAYIVGLQMGWALPQVALFASAVAAIKCTQLGGRAGIPNLKQTLTFLRERGCKMPASRW